MILPRLLRSVFHLLYHSFAWSYDYIAWIVSAGYWKQWVFSAIPFIDVSQPILEIGHGPGHLIRKLHQVGLQPVGIDLSPQMIRRASKYLARECISARLIRARAQDLPFSTKSFGTIIATFPAEYISHSQSWKSFERVLSDNGRILIVYGAKPFGKNPLHLISQLVFWITGQSQSEPGSILETRLNQGLKSISLKARVEVITIKKSRVYLIIAERNST